MDAFLFILSGLTLTVWAYNAFMRFLGLSETGNMLLLLVGVILFVGGAIVYQLKQLYKVKGPE